MPPYKIHYENTEITLENSFENDVLNILFFRVPWAPSQCRFAADKFTLVQAPWVSTVIEFLIGTAGLPIRQHSIAPSPIIWTLQSSCPSCTVPRVFWKRWSRSLHGWALHLRFLSVPCTARCLRVHCRDEPFWLRFTAAFAYEYKLNKDLFEYRT